MMVGSLGLLRPATVAQVLWTPLNLGSALVVWWDPTQGVTQSGGASSQWVDRVGGVVARQSTASAQPTYSSTARNGKPGFLFNGSQNFDFTPSASFPNGAAASVILIAGYNNASSTDGAFSYGNGNNLNWRAVGTGGGNVAVGLYASDYGSSVAWNGFDRCVIWTQNGTALSLDVDTTVSTATLSTPNTSLVTGSIGRYNGGASNTFHGVIQQVLIVNRTLTTSEQQKLEGWESWTDGKSGSNLPSGHPYKSRPPYVSDP